MTAEYIYVMALSESSKLLCVPSACPQPLHGGGLRRCKADLVTRARCLLVVDLAYQQ